MRLFRTLTLMLVFLTAVPVVGVGVMLIDSTVDIVKTLSWELQQERTTNTGRELGRYFQGMLEDIELLATHLGVEHMSVQERQGLLRFLLQKRPELNAIAFYDSRGEPLPNQLAFDAGRVLPSELVRHQQEVASLDLGRAATQDAVFGPPTRVERAGRPALGIARRVEDVVPTLIRLGAGDAAFLGLELSLGQLRAELVRLWGGQRGQALVLAPGRRLLARAADPSAPDLPLEALTAAVPEIGRALGGSAMPVSGTRPVQLQDGRELLLSYAPMAQPPWLVVTAELLDDVYLGPRRMVWQVVGVTGFALALAVALGLLFAFGLTRPISRLVRGSLAIARGKFGTEIDVRTRNELGELAHTFNYMSSQLLHYDQQNRELLESLERGYLETLRALANSIDAKDPYTRGHSDRVTEVALAIGRELGLDGERLNVLRYAGILHDIGKIGIHEDILGKKGRLDEAELTVMRQHPVLGEKIIEPIDFLQPVRALVKHHHEWWDGSGYPDGLAGEAIPLGARILCAADTYDAATSDRPYQKAVDDRESIEIVLRLREKQFDPAVADALIRIIRRRLP
jgi:putative nucleotidyltransferase with HDIG domain